MEVFNESHFKVIDLISEKISGPVYYGGSVEDFLILENAYKPIGDLDIMVYDEKTLNELFNLFDIETEKESYFNRFFSQKFTKYVTHYNGIKIDILYSEQTIDKNKHTSTVYKGRQFNHRNREYKIEVLKEWVDKSMPDDLWANEKFSKILKRYL